MTTVVFVLVPNLHLLYMAGPAQVFSAADDLGHDYRLHFVADHPQLAAHQGLSINASTEWPTLTADDLVIVPGWRARCSPPTER